MPEGQDGLSAEWVHLRAEAARFRTKPWSGLALLRNSGHTANVAQARSVITTADDQLVQIDNMVDAPAPDVPPTTVMAADSAEPGVLLKAAIDESAWAAAGVQRAQQQAGKMTTAQQDLTAARQGQDEVRAELDTVRQD
ncbi:hypothetical protein ACWDKQ_34820 [Saccharopolyspora sp. NPDC000995]